MIARTVNVFVESHLGRDHAFLDHHVAGIERDSQIAAHALSNPAKPQGSTEILLSSVASVVEPTGLSPLSRVASNFLPVCWRFWSIHFSLIRHHKASAETVRASAQISRLETALRDVPLLSRRRVNNRCQL